MPLYDDPVDRLVDFEDRFAEFARFTLQGEQDFHVGLRSDLEREYQRYGVRSEIFVSTPSPSTFKTLYQMERENQDTSTRTSCDDAPQEASKIVSSVLSNVNNKLHSGEITLVNGNQDNSNVNPLKSVKFKGTIDTAATIPETPASFQATAIPEFEEALKNITDRIERILSPSKGGTKKELLDGITSQISVESLHKLNRQSSLAKIGVNDEEIPASDAINAEVMEAEHNSKLELSVMTDLVKESESSMTKRPSSVEYTGSPQLHDDKDNDQECFNFEEIIRKKTGRGLEDSVTLDVEAEKEWELEQENMPMDIISSPDSHKVYPVKNKEKVTSNGPIPQHLIIEDAEGSENNVQKNKTRTMTGSLKISTISDDKKSAEVLETEISVLQKEVAWLEDEVGILRQTVVETNAKLAESHQLRRNLEEELSLMHRKNSGLEQTTAATMKQLTQKMEEGLSQVEVESQSQESLRSSMLLSDDKSPYRSKKSKLCTIL